MKLAQHGVLCLGLVAIAAISCIVHDVPVPGLNRAPGMPSFQTTPRCGDTSVCSAKFCLVGAAMYPVGTLRTSMLAPVESYIAINRQRLGETEDEAILRAAPSADFSLTVPAFMRPAEAILRAAPSADFSLTVPAFPGITRKPMDPRVDLSAPCGTRRLAESRRSQLETLEMANVTLKSMEANVTAMPNNGTSNGTSIVIGTRTPLAYFRNRTAASTANSADVVTGTEALPIRLFRVRFP